MKEPKFEGGSEGLKEPKIDLSGFRLEHGSIEELIQHFKDWVRWHVGGGHPLQEAVTPKQMPKDEKPATKGDK
jgi:hypothetical protein